MIDRRPRGRRTRAAELSAPKPSPRPVLPQPHTIDLARRLNLARADYREGDIAAAERAAAALATELDRALRTTGGSDPMLRALVGSVATLNGLIGLVAGDPDTGAAFAAAVASFEPVRELVERHGDLAADYGVALAFGGAPHRAGPVLERAISLGEDTPDVRRALAVALRDSGFGEQALELLDALVERAPFDWQAHGVRAELAARLRREPVDVASAWLAAARALLAADRFAAAAAAFARAEELLPRLGVDDELGYAEALAGDGRTADALRHARAAAEAAGTPARLVDAAELYTRLGELDAAGDLVRIALAADPGCRDAKLLQARLFLATGRTDAARSIVDDLVASVPGDVRAHVLRGMVALRSGDPAAAVDALTHADSLDPGQPDVLVNLGSALCEAGELERASAVLDRAVQLTPDDAWALELRGRVRYHLGRSAEAEADLRALPEPAPEARALLGDLLRLRGAHEEALAMLDSAVAEDPGIGWAWASRGDILIARGEPAAARESFEQALRHDEHHVPALIGLANVLLDLDGADSVAEAERAVLRALESAPDAADAHALLGEVRRRQGRLAEALASLDRAVALAPDYGYALGTRGEVFLALHDKGAPEALDRAVRSLDRALRRDPDQPDLLVRRGTALLGIGQIERALADLRRAVDLGVDRPEVRAVLAEAAGAHRDALAEAESVLSADPDHVVALAVRGAARVSLDDLDGGLADLRRAVERDPVNVFAVRQLTVALGSAGRWEEAIAAVERAAAREPGDVELLRVQAEVLVAAGDHRSALGVLDELLGHAPDDQEVLRLLGAALAAAGRHEEAVSVLERLVELVPDEQGAVIRLANEHARAGRFDLALSHLDSVPADPAVLTARASILADVGRWDEAIAAAEKAVARDGTDRAAHAALGWASQHGDSVDAHRSMLAYQEAVRLDPEDPWARKGLANALYLLGRRDEAREHYEWVAARLAGTSPRDPYHNALRGWCLYRLSRHIPAVDCLQRAVDDPDLRPGVLFDLMLAQLAAGDEDLARQSLAALRSELRRLPPARRRGLTAVGLDNLRTATANELADRPAAHRLLETVLNLDG